MKIVYGFLCMLLIIVLHVGCRQHYSAIIMTPIWKILDSQTTQAPQFGGKWILAGTISLQKKLPELIFLQQLQLRWHGSYLPTLMASLYTKKSGKPFLPIEAYVIADGIWNSDKQTILFPLLQPVSITYQTFYFVLTIPKQQEHLVQNGFFTIEPDSLPTPFHQATAQKEAILYGSAISAYT